MSAFLGPIHYWVYNKIALQEEFIKDILLLSAKENWDNKLEQKLSEKYGVIGAEPLEDVIDYGNIHGWLQSKLSITEGRLAMAVTILLSQDVSRMGKLIEAAYEFGKKHSIEENANTDQAFQVLNDSLIDGMPCDGVNKLMERRQTYTKWKQTICVHHQYWDMEQGDVGVYYELRKAIIKGMLSQTRIEFKVLPEGVYELVLEV